MGTEAVSSALEASEERAKILSEETSFPKGDKWHQIIRDKVGYLFFNIASLCTDPACKMHEKTTFLKLAMSEPKGQNLKEKLSKVAQKTYLTAQASLLFPITVFTGPVGMVFRLLGYFTQYSEFNYLKGNAKEKEFPLDNKASVFFLNTCFIGGGFPLTHGGVLPWKSRIDEIIEKIKKADSDIVCLSEVYDFKAAQTLYNKLKDEYPHFYLNVGPQFFAAKSGLFVASKYKIQNPHFIDFHSTLVHNKNSNRRGCFAFEAVDKENKPITKVYATHLEYSKDDTDPSDKEKKARKDEIDLIITDIKNSEIISPTILTGDLNFSEKEYNETDLVKYFKKTNKNAEGTCRRDEFNKKLWNQKIDEKAKKEKAFDLDHTFILRKSPKDERKLAKFRVKTEIIPSFDETSEILSALSDHHAMKTEITV